MQYKPVVYSNTVQSMVAILKAMERLNISFDNADRMVSFMYVGSRWESLVRNLCTWNFIRKFFSVNELSFVLLYPFKHSSSIIFVPWHVNKSKYACTYNCC